MHFQSRSGPWVNRSCFLKIIHPFVTLWLSSASVTTAYVTFLFSLSTSVHNLVPFVLSLMCLMSNIRSDSLSDWCSRNANYKYKLFQTSSYLMKILSTILIFWTKVTFEEWFDTRKFCGKKEESDVLVPKERKEEKHVWTSDPIWETSSHFNPRESLIITDFIFILWLVPQSSIGVNVKWFYALREKSWKIIG